MQATFVQEGLSIDHTPAADIVAGDVVLVGTSLVGIAKRGITALKLGAIALTGVFDVVQAAVAFTAGDAVYWDADGSPVGGEALSGAATSTATANTFMGFALADTEATDATVRLVLRSVEASAAETLSLGQLGDVGAVEYTAGHVIVADGDSYEDVPVSGDGTLSGAGVLAITGFAAMPTIPSATVVAAGDSQATATEIATGFTLVTGADASVGAKLPAAAAGKVCIVKNADADNAVLKLYPETGDAINALAANASLDMAAKTSVMLVAYDDTTWYTLPLLPS